MQIRLAEAGMEEDNMRNAGRLALAGFVGLILGVAGSGIVGVATGAANTVPAFAPPVEEVPQLTTTAITPVRILDTRPNEPAIAGSDIAVGAGESRVVQAAGLGPIPADAVAVIVNVTAVNATEPSFLTAYPSGQPRPLAALLNPQPGQLAFNASTIDLGGGTFELFNAFGQVDVIVDVVGFLTQRLQVDVGYLRNGEVLGISPMLFGGIAIGSFPAGAFADWAPILGPSQARTALKLGIAPSPDRYPSGSTATMDLLVATNDSATEVCFRLRSLDPARSRVRPCASNPRKHQR